MEFVRDAAASGNLHALTVALSELPSAPNRSIQLGSVISSTMHGGHMDCFELLVDNGASLEHSDAAGQRPVHQACANHNQLGFLMLLLEIQPELINSVNVDGATPLHVASNYGNELGVEHLLNSGADTESRNFAQRTPLHLACHSGFPVTVFQLLNGSADREASDANGRRPLHFACALESSVCAELLLEHHADVEALDLEGHSPLAVAMMSESLDCFHLLLSRGADPMARDVTRRTALHWACMMDDDSGLPYAQDLINHGADVDAGDDKGRTALHVVCEFPYIDCFNFLMGAGVDVNVCDLKGKTALHRVVSSTMTHFSTQVQMINRLLLAGADPSAETVSGERPDQIAVIPAIRDLLLNRV